MEKFEVPYQREHSVSWLSRWSILYKRKEVIPGRQWSSDSLGADVETEAAAPSSDWDVLSPWDRRFRKQFAVAFRIIRWHWGRNELTGSVSKTESKDHQASSSWVTGKGFSHNKWPLQAVPSGPWRRVRVSSGWNPLTADCPGVRQLPCSVCRCFLLQTQLWPDRNIQDLQWASYHFQCYFD